MRPKYNYDRSYIHCLCTVLRTIGIPARPVTNFESAHDSDGNRALDRYWDLQDEIVDDKSNDSIWYVYLGNPSRSIM